MNPDLTAFLSNPLWYITRGTGLVAFVLLTAAVVVGVLTAQRKRVVVGPRFVTQAVHRNVSLLAIGFVVVHILTTVTDGFVPIGWSAAVNPFASPYRTLGVGLGALAFDLMALLVLTSLARVRLGARTWRFVHWAAYAAWPLALAHFLRTGTDGRTHWAWWLAGLSVLAVFAGVLRRLGQRSALHPAAIGMPR